MKQNINNLFLDLSIKGKHDFSGHRDEDGNLFIYDRKEVYNQYDLKKFKEIETKLLEAIKEDYGSGAEIEWVDHIVMYVKEDK